MYQDKIVYMLMANLNFPSNFVCVIPLLIPGPVRCNMRLQVTLKSLKKSVGHFWNFPSWWFQPLWKILVKLDNFPK